MSQSTHKHACVLHRSPGGGVALTAGYLPGLPEPGAEGPLRLLTPAGVTAEFAGEDLLAVVLVPRFVAAAADPLAWAAHTPGPRQPGLWVRAHLREYRSLEGILASDLLMLSSGITLTPLVLEAAWQRLWIPRAALAALTPVEVIRNPRRRRPVSARVPGQIALFTPDPPEIP